MTDPTAWRDRAACRDAVEDFTIDRETQLEEAEALAWRYCHRCLVRLDCRMFADACSPRVVGVWAARWHPYSGKPVELLDRAEAS